MKKYLLIALLVFGLCTIAHGNTQVPATSIAVNTTGFTKNFNSGDSNLQAILNTLDQQAVLSGSGAVGSANQLTNIPTLCPAGTFPKGIDVFGNALGCTQAGSQWTGTTSLSYTGPVSITGPFSVMGTMTASGIVTALQYTSTGTTGQWIAPNGIQLDSNGSGFTFYLTPTGLGLGAGNSSPLATLDVGLSGTIRAAQFISSVQGMGTWVASSGIQLDGSGNGYTFFVAPTGGVGIMESAPATGLGVNGNIDGKTYSSNGTPGISKTCTTYPTVVNGLVTSC